jgi:RNA polymerase sigma factor (sigma-70 family)
MLSHFAKHRNLYVGYALKICGDAHDAEDLVQEMYLKLDGILKKTPEKKITDSYIYLILYTTFIDIKRQYHPERIGQRDLKDEERIWDLMQVNEALSKMRFVDREILIKTRQHSLREVAEMMGIHCTAVFKREKRALQKLKQIWQESQEVSVMTSPR